MWQLLRLLSKIKNFRIKSARTRSILLYLFFVVISALFWCFLTLNQTVQRDMTIPFEITSIPQGVTLLNNVPTSIDVTVRDRGSSFVEGYFRPQKKLKIRFSDYANKNIIKLNNVQLQTAIKRQLSQNATIVAMSVEQISVKYTSLPGKRVPIKWYYNIEADTPRYVQNGPVWKSQDSVVVYSDQETLDETQKIYTNLIQETNLRDTLRRRVTFEQRDGMKIVPTAVTLVVPVEQMFTKRKKVAINVLNQPTDVSLIIFPSTVEVTYLVPKSQLKASDANVKVMADYNSVVNMPHHSNKLKLVVSGLPVRSIHPKLSVDSVEYILEKH